MISKEKFENTALDDDAIIYSKNTKTEKENVKEMTGKEKWLHFKEYYLGTTLLIVCVVAIVVFLVYDFLKQDEVCVLNVAVFDESLDEDAKEKLISELEEAFGIDGEGQYVSINDSYYSEEDGYSKLEVYMSAEEIDVIIAAPEVFERLAGSGYFSDISVLENEYGAEFNGTFYEAAGFLEDYEGEDIFEDKQSGMGEVLPYGIELSKCKKYMEMATSQEQPVVGITCNSGRIENAVAFLELLMQN